MPLIRYTHQQDKAMIAIFRFTLTPDDIAHIEGAAAGITVCDYDDNYEFWREFVRSITVGTGIDEVDVYSIRCSDTEQVSDQSLHCFLRVSQADNLVALIPVTEDTDRVLRSTIEAFYLNKSSVDDSDVEYCRMAMDLQYLDDDPNSFAFETTAAVNRFKAEQAELRQRHLKNSWHKINMMNANCS